MPVRHDERGVAVVIRHRRAVDGDDANGIDDLVPGHEVRLVNRPRGIKIPQRLCNGGNPTAVKHDAPSLLTHLTILNPGPAQMTALDRLRAHAAMRVRRTRR
jgi:hypothetical protein